MNDIYYEVERIIPVKDGRGRVDIIFQIRTPGSLIKNDAIIKVGVFFTSNQKNIDEVISEALKQAKHFANMISHTENFLVDE